MKAITILGNQAQKGVYLLRIQVQEEVAVRFGRFRQGQLIVVPAGEYLYVGSAMAERGSMTLARRLLRHATRAAPRQPHKIRAEMISTFQAAGLGGENVRPPKSKKLFWNVDYLLQETAVELSHVIILRSHRRLESELAGWLEGEPETAVLARGLGAGDHPGSTHLLRVTAATSWWERLLAELPALQNGTRMNAK